VSDVTSSTHVRAVPPRRTLAGRGAASHGRRDRRIAASASSSDTLPTSSTVAISNDAAFKDNNPSYESSSDSSSEEPYGEACDSGIDGLSSLETHQLVQQVLISHPALPI